MYLLIVFFPLCGFLIAAVLGRYIGTKGSVIVTTVFLFFSFLISLVIFYEVVLSHSIILINLFT